MRSIYLDYNATTPIDPAVAAAMQPYLAEEFGNPSSLHEYGRKGKEAVDRAREQTAALINARSEEIIFTGGGSEASNMAIKGVSFPLLFGRSATDGCAVGWVQGKWLCRLRGLLRPPARNIHVITSAIEHPATLRPCAFLEQLGCRVTLLPVDRNGVVDCDQLRQALKRPTALVSIMHSNNEVGTLQPIKEIARIAHEHGALVHTDVAQTLGKLPVDVRGWNVDFLTIAGHKLYAPKGVGALFVREGIDLEPLIHGAGHEHGRRAGTENVPYIVGLGQACELARQSLPRASHRLHVLRERLWQQLQQGLGDRVELNGHPTERLPNTLNCNFLGHIGAELLEKTPRLAASTGSACHEGVVALSPVLKAMGIAPEHGQGAIRLSVGRYTTEEQIDQASEMLVLAARPSLIEAA